MEKSLAVSSFSVDAQYTKYRGVVIRLLSQPAYNYGVINFTLN